MHRQPMLRASMSAILLAALVAAGCEGNGTPGDTADRAEARDLALSVETPGTLGMGQEGIVLLRLENRGSGARDDVRIELFMPTWVEIGRVEPEGTEVTMQTMEGEGTRLSYDPPGTGVEPGQSERVTQRFRIPPEEWWETERMTGDRTIRARLVHDDGTVLGAEVRTRLQLDTAALRLMDARTTTGEDEAAVPVRRNRIGPVRLGMSADEVRAAVPGTRDTTWTAEGMQERGISVPVRDGIRVTARLADGSVDRIEARDPAVRTGAGLGVGSRLAELRQAYGETCLAVAEGRVVAWFPAEPGVSFGLVGIDAGAARDTEALPSDARVRSLWVRDGQDTCP